VSLSNAQVVVSRGSFDGNKAMEGGALAVEGESNVEIGSCILSKNGAGLRVAPTGFPQQVINIVRMCFGAVRCPSQMHKLISSFWLGCA
jgi:hypothetical protein